MGWAILGTVAGLILLDSIMRLFFLPVVLRIFENKPPLKAQLADPNPDAQCISFTTTDGLTLRGSLYRDNDRPCRGLILFCPELGGNHWSAMLYCEGLWQAGFDILAFDFRNQGESDHMPGYEPLHWLTDFEVDDTIAAIAYVKQRDDLRGLPLGLFGVSRGGGAALATAARCRDIKCVACDSAFSTDRMMAHYTSRWITLFIPGWLARFIPSVHTWLTLQMVRRVSQFRRGCRYTKLERLLPRLRTTPVFMISGARDNYVDPNIAKSMAQKIGPSCQKVWIVPGAKHNMSRQMDASEYDRRLVAFFSQLAAETHSRKVTQPQH